MKDMKPCDIFYQKAFQAQLNQTKTRPGADYGSDDELLIAKFRLTFKKVRKTTRPFRYDLNQTLMIIYTESEKQFQGIRSDRLPEELWMEVCDIVQKAGIRTILKKNKCKKAKQLSEEALQIAVKEK